MPSNIVLQLLGIGVLTTLWLFSRRRSRAATFNNLRGPPAASWLSGSLDKLVNKRAWDFHRQISEAYGGVARVKELFGRDCLYIYDPKALHHILVKDQYTYEETDAFITNNRIIFGEGLLTTLGEKHQRQRKMLNPVFSIAHLREMGEPELQPSVHPPADPPTQVSIFYQVGHKLRDTLVKMTASGPKEIDILGWNTRLALELIGQSGLGWTFDSMEENSTPHPYAVAVKQFVPLSGDSPAIVRQWLVPTIAGIGSPRFRRFLINLIPSKSLHNLRDVIDTLHKTSVEIIQAKRKALQEGDPALEAQIGRGKDIISILMKANLEASDEDKLSDAELEGQVTTFTFAATDTTSGALTRILHLLATYKEYQTKLREEIRNARKENGGQDIGYDTLSTLPFLDAICRETLRFSVNNRQVPPVSYLFRVARADIILPLSSPVKGINGDDIHEIPVSKGMHIIISILSSNRDPKLWGPDSFEWKPERWLKPLPEAVLSAHLPAVYSHLLTFIGGGRSCIGFKFSQLEMKVTLALLLEHLEFSLADKRIVWQMTGIATPHPNFDSVMPSLPIVISRAD
ncbi:hypothetical protein NLJ89_g2096 [Agrocybe chaxingu]|uniref:Cytochrome P450 n=1 Tax=Agrocybe chaxingu TaxID=84603 RepID=A0A9W8MYU8_9AGAR|nr:hypothetical protein NLJ89_g2096 [Agrocybe chaxingu]